LSEPGTYTLTTNLDGSGDEYCIFIDSGGVKLNLNGHKITDTGSSADYGVYVGAASTTIGNDKVYGGRISNYEYGVYVDSTRHTTLSDLSILLGSHGIYGVFEEYTLRSLTSAVKIFLNSTYDETGWYSQYGAYNTVSGSFVNYTSANGAPSLVGNEYDYKDTFSNDNASCRTSTGSATYDCSGYGFYEYYSNGNTYSGDKSYGNAYGFYLYDDGDGTVTATNNVATDYNLGIAYGMYGFYNYANYYDAYDSTASSTYSGNSVEGFPYGVYDYYSYNGTYSSNTVKYASSYGYYFYYPAKLSITGNTAQGINTTGNPYSSGAYGFYFSDAYSYYLPAAFKDNHSNDNYYGYYSDSAFIPGSGNTAKGNYYRSYNVETG
jgi:parallel beta-helix repeat protein